MMDISAIGPKGFNLNCSHFKLL